MTSTLFRRNLKGTNQKKFFSIIGSICNITQNPDEFNKIFPNKLSIKKCNQQPELGQPTFWTHPHLFDSSSEKIQIKQEVTPGISKLEFEQRRDEYVKHLTNFQMFYFSSKFSRNEKNDLKSKTMSDWMLNGYDNLTLEKNFISVIPSAMVSFMAPDVPYTFRQNSDFLYLTGFKVKY